MDLNIQVSDASGSAVVSLAGELGPATAPAFSKALDHLCEKSRPVLVDLDGLTRIDGLGLSVLAQAFRRLRHVNRALIIVAPRPGIRKVIYESGMEDFLPICRTLDEAAALVTVLQRPVSPTTGPSTSDGTTA